MSEQKATRKLTAIFYADVAGYSRLTQRDELDTHQRVMATLDMSTDMVGNGGGKVLRYAGDAVLAEFPSVVAAVETAVAIQNNPHARNADHPPGGEVLIRIGIITELSKFRSFFVIARNSAFAFKGTAKDIKDISRKLGVRYVVEGSVRRAGNRVRITAQLIDAVDDKHLWAERYDRDLEDIFAVQDEVTLAIVTTIEPQLASTERQRARRKPVENLDAWECYQRGLWHGYQYTEVDSRHALEFMARAIDLDPTFAPAYAGLAFSLYVFLLFGFSKDRARDIARGLEAGREAVALDEHDPFAHVGLGRMHIIAGEPEQAVGAFDRAISLSPSFAVAHYGRAHALWHCGRPAESVASHEDAIRLSPRDPLLWSFMASRAIALVMLKRNDEALEWSRKAQQQPITAIWAYMGELSALGLLDRKDEAKAALGRARKLEPDLTISFIQQALPITHEPSRELFLDGLARAGVPA